MKDQNFSTRSGAGRCNRFCHMSARAWRKKTDSGESSTKDRSQELLVILLGKVPLRDSVSPTLSSSSGPKTFIKGGGMRKPHNCQDCQSPVTLSSPLLNWHPHAMDPKPLSWMNKEGIHHLHPRLCVWGSLLHFSKCSSPILLLSYFFSYPSSWRLLCTELKTKCIQKHTVNYM